MFGHRIYKGIVEDRNDPLKLGRMRVRVIGYHSENRDDIPTEHLPWAMPMLPVTEASMNGIGQSPVGAVEGTTVMLIFNDEEDMQDPIVIGSLGGIPRDIPRTHSNRQTTVEQREAVFKEIPLEDLSDVEGRQVDLLVVHCTATKPSMDIGVDTVDGWHRQNGWNGIGYHALIRRNGVVEQGRPLSRSGAHAAGYNSRSIGVALVGGVDANNRPENNFTNQQFSALRAYVENFLQKVPNGKIIGHNEVSSKACPSFDVQAWLANNFDGAIASDIFKEEYDEEQEIDGDRLEESGENKQDVGEVEGFSDDLVAGTAKTNPNFPQNKQGFGDPNGVYPKVTHVEETDTNRLARNEKVEETVVQKKKDGRDTTTTANGATIEEPSTPYNARYPYNHVKETESGHIIEYDDTPNAERIHTYHKSGTFEEIHPNGTRVQKIVGDDYVIINNNGNLYVKGNVNITVDGDTNMKVNGATTLESVGDILAHTDSNFKLTADGRIDLIAEGRMRLVGSRIDLNP